METLSQPLTNVMIAQDTDFISAKSAPASPTALACVLMWPHGSRTAQTPGGAERGGTPYSHLLCLSPFCWLQFPAGPPSLEHKKLLGGAGTCQGKPEMIWLK